MVLDEVAVFVQEQEEVIASLSVEVAKAGHGILKHQCTYLGMCLGT